MKFKIQRGLGPPSSLSDAHALGSAYEMSH